MSQIPVLLLALSLQALTVAWAGSFKGGGEHCDCLSLADLWICTKEQSCGQFDPPCFHSQIIAGDGHPNLPYARDYGASCKAHSEPGLSRCYDPLTGLELPGYEQADFCKQAWCYVDPCTCSSTVEIKTSAVLSDGSPVVVAISYANCGASNSRPKEVDSESNMTAWTSQYGQCPGFAPNDGRQCAPTSAPTPAAPASEAPTPAAPVSEAPTPAPSAKLRGKSGRPVFSCLGLVVAVSAALGAQR